MSVFQILVSFLSFHISDVYVLTMIFLSCSSVASSVLVRSLYFGKGISLPPILLRRLTHSKFCTMLIEVSTTATELQEMEEHQPDGCGEHEDLSSELLPATWRSKSSAATSSFEMGIHGGDDDDDDVNNGQTYGNRKRALAIYIMLKKEQTKQWLNWEKIQAEHRYKREWKLLANVIDRITFLIHFVVTVCTTAYVYLEVLSRQD